MYNKYFNKYITFIHSDARRLGFGFLLCHLYLIFTLLISVNKHGLKIFLVKITPETLQAALLFWWLNRFFLLNYMQFYLNYGFFTTSICRKCRFLFLYTVLLHPFCSLQTTRNKRWHYAAHYNSRKEYHDQYRPLNNLSLFLLSLSVVIIAYSQNQSESH
jgi:hypothetical protein